MTLSVTSPAFLNGSPVPAVYTCKGDNTSPLYRGLDPPSNTKSFALTMDDPDAPGGIWVHWVIYNIPVLCGTASGRASQSSTHRRQFERRHIWGKLGYGDRVRPAERIATSSSSTRWIHCSILPPVQINNKYFLPCRIIFWRKVNSWERLANKYHAAHW